MIDAHARRRRPAWGRHVVLGLFVAAASTAFAAVAPVASASSTAAVCTSHKPGASVTADQFVSCLRTGVPVDMAGVSVRGDVRLDPGMTVPGPLRCLECDFTGSFSARDVSFRAVVDLGGAVVQGPFSAAGATFGSFVFFQHGPGRTTEFMASADLSHAIFRRGVDMTNATFHDAARFEGALILGRAAFNSMAFGGPATFDNATLSGLTSFRATGFGGNASFQQAVTETDLDFTLAHFNCAVRLSELDVGGKLSFSQADFVRNRECASTTVDFGHVRAKSLTFSLGDVDVVRGSENQKSVLKMIEASALGREDISEANKAHFELLTRESSNVWDRIFYRQLAGYLVRPTYPLVALLAMFAVGMLIRVLRDRAHRKPQAYINEFRASVRSAYQKKAPEGAPSTLFATIERWVYRAQFAVLALAVAHSFPAVRELLQSL